MDKFKYKNLQHFPNENSNIKPTCKKNKYTLKLDTANDVSASFYNFSKAFYTAANLIVDRIFDKHNIDELDRYFFPVLFLYRHSIELLLKSIGCITVTDKSDRSDFFKSTFHDPKSILQYIVNNTTISLTEELEWLSKYFQNIAVFDKASDSFRYPYHITKENDLFSDSKYTFERVFQKQTHINLPSEVHKISSAYEILNNLYCTLMNISNNNPTNKYNLNTSTFLDEGGNYYEQSVVGYEYHHNDFYAHCSSYLECANFLKDYMIDEYENGKLSGYLFYPMCYLYRNDVELLLKAIIFDFSGISLQNICDILYKNKHNIFKLFSFIEDDILPMYDIDKTDNFIINTKRYCEILHNFDSDSSKFRYPVNKDCNPYQTSTRYYSFVETGVFLESLCNAVDSIHGEIQNRAEFLAEMESEYSSYY